MNRIQLFEFEDFKWFPNVIRESMTKLLNVFNKIMKVDEVIVNGITPVLEKTNHKTIVDLGSGAGGAMPSVLNILNKQRQEENKLKLILTDLYPNKQFVIKYHDNKNIKYNSKPVDATNTKELPNGIKTMINCYHHMPKDKARKILIEAQNNKQSLFIYEVTGKKVPLFIWWILLPLSLSILFLMTWVITPSLKNVSWKQLIFTYIIPIIPICYAWDGQASMQRTYLKQDFDTMLNTVVKDSNYLWNYEEAYDNKGKRKGYYFIGMPL